MDVVLVYIEDVTVRTATATALIETETSHIEAAAAHTATATSHTAPRTSKPSLEPAATAHEKMAKPFLNNHFGNRINCARKSGTFF